MKQLNVMRRYCLIVLAGLVMSGCASTTVNVAPTPPANYETIGSTTGSSTGSLGVLAAGYYFIPMGLNSRIEKAYQDALANAPGATGLIDVTYQEDWYWWFIGTARKVTVQGTAIKEISE